MRTLRAFVARHRDHLLLLAGAFAFALAYLQVPLYFSNQHQYFLHGLAQVGFGDLASDWLANTVDPAPVFTALVVLTLRFFSANLFYVYFAVLAGVYFVSLMAIARMQLPVGPGRHSRLLLVGAAMIVVHSFLFRKWLAIYGGFDFFWYMQSGLAGQYLLGPGLQPSVFGILLVAAVAAYLNERHFFAAGLVVIGCTFHATYLLPGALLTLGFVADFLRRGRRWDAACLGLGTLIGVLPVVYFALSNFASTTPELSDTARYIMAVDRIPHHALISDWFGLTSILQIAWVAVAIVLAGRRWLWTLGLPAGLALLLSLVQFASGDLTLALLFPWRLSVILVPVATAIIFARLFCLLPFHRSMAPAAVLLSVVAACGYFTFDRYWQHEAYDQVQPLLLRIRQERQPGELYLVPATMEQFRFVTGAAIYIDHKSIPYLDREVVMWNARLTRAHSWYRGFKWGSPPTAQRLADDGITHAVLPNDAVVPAGLVRLYGAAGYGVYAVPPSTLTPPAVESTGG